MRSEKYIMSGRYICFLVLFEYGDYIEAVSEDGSFTLCVDFENYAKHFDTTEESITWAKSHKLKDGKFGVRCYWAETEEHT